MSQLQSEIVLHIWPSRWGLPSFDPLCLATIVYLQQAIPDKLRIAECNNPDLSPTGQLPFLTHEQHMVSSFESIVKYVAELNKAEIARDETMDRSARSKIVAWSSHVESHLGDIVYYALYSHLGNWTELTLPALVSMFPVPQRYYVPGRIRESYRPRLEAAGLWDLQAVEKDGKKPLKETTKTSQREENARRFQEAFGREKISGKARTLFDIYSRLLGDKEFLLLDRPTTLDILLTSHMLLLLNPTYPDPSLQTLLTTSYPTLVSHAHRVYEDIFGPSSSPLQVASPQPLQWMTLVPWPPAGRKKRSGRTEKEAEEDMRDAKMRWGFFGLTMGSLAVYLMIAFKHAVALQKMMEAKKGELSEEEEEELD